MIVHCLTEAAARLVLTLVQPLPTEHHQKMNLRPQPTEHPPKTNLTAQLKKMTWHHPAEHHPKMNLRPRPTEHHQKTNLTSLLKKMLAPNGQLKTAQMLTIRKGHRLY